MTRHENYVTSLAAARQEGEYVPICPFCGEDTVDLTGFIGICRIPVTPDGWDFASGNVDTSDEVFGCCSCEKEVPSEFVFAGMYDQPQGGAREGSEQIAT